MTITVGSLCSGYEGTGLGLRLAGWDHRLAFVADPDPAARRALAHHHPDVPNLGDITTVRWADVEPVDLLTMGFPCTNLSCAGGRAGLGVGTQSGVWANCAHAIAILRPPLALIENVPGLLSTSANRSPDATDSDMEPGPADLGDDTAGLLRAAGAVLGDLADIGYDAVWITVGAADIGAPHLRKRIFIFAWPVGGEDRARRLLAGLGRPALEPCGHDGVTGALLPTPMSTYRGDCPSERGRRTPSLVAIGALLPTPAARLGDSRGCPNVETAARRMSDEGRRNLEDAIALLPTPASRDWKSGESNIMDRNARPLNEVIVNLLPTPRATDGTNGGPNQRGSSGDLMLPSAVMLLPTPMAADAGTKRGSSAGNGLRNTSREIADAWGDYAPAIVRWEQVLGRSAPDPTEAGAKGQPRLSPAFVEWMQGLPAGYVTAVPGVSRNDALKLLGNSNPPQLYAAAIGQLARIVMELLATGAAA